MGHGRMTYPLKTARLVLIVMHVLIFLIGATFVSQSIELFITRRFPGLTEFLPNIEKSDVITNKTRLISDEMICVILLIPGTILLSLGFLGCSSIITQMPSLLYCYSIIMTGVLIVQTMLITFFVCIRMTIKKQLLARLRQAILEVYQGPLETNLLSLSIVWDWIMYHFKCCGMENKDDFNMTMNWNRSNPWMEYGEFKYPLTCCAMDEKFNIHSKVFNRVLTCAIHGYDIYEMSCYQKLINLMYSIQGCSFLVIVCLSLIELFALTFILILLTRSRIERISSSCSSRVNHGNVYIQI